MCVPAQRNQNVQLGIQTGECHIWIGVGQNRDVSCRAEYNDQNLKHGIFQSHGKGNTDLRI